MEFLVNLSFLLLLFMWNQSVNCASLGKIKIDIKSLTEYDDYYDEDYYKDLDEKMLKNNDSEVHILKLIF